MVFSLVKYYFFLFLATTLSCHAQPDSDMYAALFNSRRSPPRGKASSIEVSASSKSPLFGNIAEELQRAKALQTELNAVRKALDLANHSNKESRRKGTLRGTTDDLETVVEPPSRGLKKYAKYSYYSYDYYSSKSKSHKSYDYYYYGSKSHKSKSHKSKSHKSKSAKKHKDYYSSYYGSKKSKSYKSNKVLEELEECQAELAKQEDKVSYLLIQTASACQVQRSTDSDGATSYKLVTDTISESTYVFSDRPYRIEGTVPTANITATWSDMFQTSNPNTGVTLVSKDETQTVGPLVVVFSEPDYQGNGQLAYNIEQSPNQEGVLSIESIFDGTSLDSVSFEYCSFFIDEINITLDAPIHSPVGHAKNKNRILLKLLEKP